MNLINEADKPIVKRTVVVYSGRFQPFHKGHYISYLKLAQKFGKSNVYIGTSNDTSGPKSPFSFDEKVKIITKMFGISKDKIVQVRNPYAPKEILSQFDGKTTAYVAAVGEKDADRLAGKYFKPYKEKAGYGYDEIGYVYAVPAESNPISGTDVRNWLGNGDDDDKKKGFLKAYSKFDKEVFGMITGKLNEEGFPGGIGTGLNLPGGYINGAPTGSTDELYDPISEILGRVAMEEIFEEFVKTYFKEESEAEKMGLKHLGGGYYGKEGQTATHKSEDGKIRTLTPDELASVQKKQKGGIPNAPLPPPKPGQPVNKGATAQGKVDTKKPDVILPGKKAGTVIRKSDGKPDVVMPAPKKAGGVPPPPPLPKKAGGVPPVPLVPPPIPLKGAELKSSAEKSDKEKKTAETKEKLDNVRKELSKEENETVDKVNNPESPERKSMVGNIKSGLQKLGKGLVNWAHHKKEMVGGTMDAAKAVMNGKKIGSTKNKETGEWEYSDEKRKEQIKHIGHTALDVGLIFGSMALGGAGVAIAKTVMAGGATAAGIGAAAGSGAAGAFTHGAVGFGVHLGKDIAKHATLEAMGLGAAKAAGAGAALSAATLGIFEGIDTSSDTQKFSANLLKTVAEKMETYKMSDEQLLASLESYNKQKPQQAVSKLVGNLNETLSETKHQSIQNFVEYATKRLKLKETPKITLISGREFAEVKTSLGGYNPDDKSIYVATEGRLTADILRTVAHEMVHRKQDEMYLVKNAEKDGADGSPIENQAHAVAGILMREYGRINKQIYNEVSNVGSSNTADVPDGAFIKKGKKRKLDSDKGESWYTGGGYTQTDFPEADAMFGDEDGEERTTKYTIKNLPSVEYVETDFVKEDINLDVDKGDEVLMGKFKNKRVTVKDIGTDDHGMPTINGKKATTFRLGNKGQNIFKQDEKINFKEAQAVKLNELKLKDLVGNQYKYVIGSGEEKYIGNNDKKYVLGMIAKALEAYLYDSDFALNYLDGSQQKQYDSFFKNEILKPMLTKIDFTLNTFFILDKDKIKWKLSSNDTRKMVDEIFSKNSKIPSDIKKEYYEYRLEYAGVKLKESTKRDYKAEYKKFQSSTKSKKYRAELNKYNRDKGTYGNGDGKDASHKNGKIAGFEDESVNRGRAEKSRLKKESVNESLLTEGGAYGHMSHPFDDMDLTFGDLKNIITGALTGELELTREKTDGQALAISWKSGRLIAARNKGHLANAGANAMGIEDVASKFSGRGGLTDAYNFAMKDLSAAIQSLSEPQRKKIFNEGKCFMNLEVIWPTSVNVIPYGQALLVFHNTTCYDESGKAVSADQSAATKLAGMIKQVNADVQSKYTIQGPPVTKLPKNEDLSSKQGKYLSKLQKLQSEFELSNNDGVSEYHQAWWTNFIDKSKVELQKLEKDALIRRWAFGDKSFRLNTISDKEAQEWAIDNDKVNVVKQQKENVRQFEEIFLGVGADVLAFMGSVLTVNPNAAVADMKGRLESVAEKVRGSGDVSKIAKLKMELERLASIGGKDKIVPNEGIVFVYNGNTYKLTGTFAPLNQILGIFYE